MFQELCVVRLFSTKSSMCTWMRRCCSMNNFATITKMANPPRTQLHCARAPLGFSWGILSVLVALGGKLRDFSPKEESHHPVSCLALGRQALTEYRYTDALEQMRIVRSELSVAGSCQCSTFAHGHAHFEQSQRRTCPRSAFLGTST